MGNKSSTTTFRRVQPSSAKYNRLSSSSKSDAQQPLLLDNYDQNLELLKHEIEENRKKNESLEKRNVTMEKDIRELRAEIKSKKDIEKNVAALKKQVAEWKSTVAHLQSASKSGVLLEKKVENLELRLKKVEVVEPLITLVDNGESKRPLLELSLIDEMPAISPVPDLLGNSMEQEFGYPSDNSADNLAGCLLVLIFLVTVLIGLNL